MQYGYISGYPMFRQSLAKFLEKGYDKRKYMYGGISSCHDAYVSATVCEEMDGGDERAAGAEFDRCMASLLLVLWLRHVPAEPPPSLCSCGP